MPEDFTLVFIILGSLVVIFAVLVILAYPRSNAGQTPTPKRQPTGSGRAKSSEDQTFYSTINHKIKKLESLLNINQNQSLSKDDILYRLDNLYLSVENLKKKLDTHKLSASFQNFTSTSNRPTTVPPTSEIEINSATPTSRADLILQMYNQAVLDRGTRPQFWSKYSYLTLGNVKAVELRLGTTDKPEFREVSNGDFIAIKVQEQYYILLLQFDLTLTPQRYKEGGIEFLFECSDYDPNASYSNVQVKKPAVFERNGDRWNLKHKGILIL